ncbi:minor capsid protein [Lactococcus formosensis]|uniref:minor capsid protein n=1 Tax=Lactococcus formosensis TaxID=1281486 RepID=UPI0024353703|nr:minor capsid protein [Lactococcus formosensis]MDG6130823.1 minor capsid protein [Lactococcus formosensis]
MKKKLSYWQKRYLKTKQLQLSKAVAYEKEYGKRLKETQKLIEQEIDSWCKKYAKKDGTIDPIDAKKLLKGSELKDFKYSLAEWERMAKQGGFNHEMDLEYYRSRVSRLQALQLQVTGLMGKQTSGDVKSLEGLLKGSYNDTYYRNIYNSQAVKGKFSSNFAHVDDKKLNAVIHSGWKGSNFSTRLWGNATHTLPNALSETLFRGIALGFGPDRLTQMARVKLKDFSENQIHRLVTTEAAHIVEQATLDSYKEIGLEKYEYLATLESHTCEVCGKLDGQVLEVSKQETGTNYPPIHPYCRCTTVPWDKWFEENDIKRWSRNEETGKGKSIDDMSYSKWKEDVFGKDDKTKDSVITDSLKSEKVDKVKPASLKGLTDEFLNEKREESRLKAGRVNAKKYDAQSDSFAKLTNEASMRIRISDIGFRRAVESGNLKSCHEFGDDFAKGRIRIEKTLFNLPENIKRSEMPKYGYLSDSDDLFEKKASHSVLGYGDITIELDDSVRKRTTYTINDSLVNKRGLITSATPVGTKPTYNGIKEKAIGEINSISEFLNSNKKTNRYIEAQYHGDLTFKNDVKRIIVPDKSYLDKLSKEFEQLKNMGIEVLVAPK